MRGPLRRPGALRLSADTVETKNGSRIVGKITSIADGDVVVSTDYAGKITIKHGPIKKFDMDGMTMVFRAQDPAMLTTVKVGDKIKFDLEKVKGQFTVTKIEKAK